LTASRRSIGKWTTSAVGSRGAGFDGVILSCAKYIEHMREFQKVTYPLLVQNALRQLELLRPALG
jgi:hypothetical protein